jgi:hypothetical protein
LSESPAILLAVTRSHQNPVFHIFNKCATTEAGSVTGKSPSCRFWHSLPLSQKRWETASGVRQKLMIYTHYYWIRVSLLPQVMGSFPWEVYLSHVKVLSRQACS